MEDRETKETPGASNANESQAPPSSWSKHPLYWLLLPLVWVCWWGVAAASGALAMPEWWMHAVCLLGIGTTGWVILNRGPVMVETVGDAPIELDLRVTAWMAVIAAVCLFLPDKSVSYYVVVGGLIFNRVYSSVRIQEPELSRANIGYLALGRISLMAISFFAFDQFERYHEQTNPAADSGLREAQVTKWEGAIVRHPVELTIFGFDDGTLKGELFWKEQGGTKVRLAGTMDGPRITFRQVEIISGKGVPPFTRFDAIIDQSKMKGNTGISTFVLSRVALPK